MFLVGDELIDGLHRIEETLEVVWIEVLDQPQHALIRAAFDLVDQSLPFPGEIDDALSSVDRGNCPPNQA